LKVVRFDLEIKHLFEGHAGKVSIFAGAEWYTFARTFDRTDVRSWRSRGGYDMAAPARTKIDLSRLDSRPVLRVVPPLVEAPPKPRPPKLRPRRAQAAHLRPPAGAHPVGSRPTTCVPPRPEPKPRLALMFVIGLVVFLSVVGIGLLANSMAGAAVPERTVVVRVQPGETLWQVAERAAPGYDTEAVVERIRELNALTGSAVLTGQALEVPSNQ
jgi:hypothetical protein